MRKPTKTFILLALTVLSITAPSHLMASESSDEGMKDRATDAASCKNVDLYFMRHLNKRKGSDPELNEKGVQTGKALSEDSRMQEFDQAFSTPYKRTEQTARLVLGNYGRDGKRDQEARVISYDPRKPKELMTKVFTDYCDQKLLIVGHSNTTPQLVQLFGGKFAVSFGGISMEYEPSILLSEKDYGKVFHIKYSDSVITQGLITLDGEE